MFFSLNVFQPAGEAKLRELGMVHHGFAILDRWGDIYWRSGGHNFTPEELEQKINEALAVAPP